MAEVNTETPTKEQVEDHILQAIDRAVALGDGLTAQSFASAYTLLRSA